MSDLKINHPICPKCGERYDSNDIHWCNGGYLITVPKKDFTNLIVDTFNHIDLEQRLDRMEADIKEIKEILRREREETKCQ